MSNDTNLRELLAYDETFSCVQCGYCLPACPTYVNFGKEAHSPRGRINLVKMAAEGKVSLNELFDPIDLCLGCRACEIVCPTNVEYGKILSSAVNVLNEYRDKNRSKTEKALRNFVLRRTLSNRGMLNLLGKGMYVFQKSKLNKGMRKVKLMNILPEPLKQLESVTPEISLPKKRQQTIQETTTISNNDIKKGSKFRIGFFPGCVMDTFFARINDQAIQLLEHAGCDVITIKEQGCCGALQHHAGEKLEAVERAKQNIEAFEKYELDYIVNAIGGCGAQLVESHLLFDKNDPWYDRALAFSKKNKDISVILSRLNLKYKRKIEKIITYQPSCHLSNVQRVVNEPFELLTKIPGITYVPLENKEMCCGSAGIYNIIHHEASMKILDDKMNDVKKNIPDIIVTTNPGCHLQMLMGLKREGLEGKVEVVHLVELLAEACL